MAVLDKSLINSPYGCVVKVILRLVRFFLLNQAVYMGTTRGCHAVAFVCLGLEPKLLSAVKFNFHDPRSCG